MTDTRHTPGPWRINKYGSIGAGEYGANPIVATVEPFYGPDTRHGSHAANARLIAAAPEMLAALIVVTQTAEILRDHLERESDTLCINPELVWARQLIAKAKGDDNA